MLNDSRFPAGWRDAVLIAVIVLATAAVLWTLGRAPICACGTVKLWFAPVYHDEGSQHLTDWYSFSHIIHGFVFYWAAWLVFAKWPVSRRLVTAVIIEAAWEILENTSFIIDRYREQTISLAYYGDSIVNSMGDIAMMIIGFLAAARLPPWFTVGLALAMEIGVGAVIRDNLTLNTIMLLWPLDIIKTWQAGA